jgi:hypothetical protein
MVKRRRFLRVEDLHKEGENGLSGLSGLSAIEKVEKIASLSNTVVSNAQQVGNVIAPLMNVKQQESVSWNTFITSLGLAFLGGIFVGILLTASERRYR